MMTPRTIIGIFKMDTRFRSILNLALHPSTGNGEAQAALDRARSMVAKNGFDNLVGAAPQPVIKEKIVYRDKEKEVVYQYRYVDRPSWTRTSVMTIKTNSRWQFSLLERIFLDAPKIGVEVFLESCEPRNKTIDSGAIIKIRICGTKNTVEQYDDLITSYIDQMNRRDKEAGRLSNSTTKLTPIEIKRPNKAAIGLILIGFLIGQLITMFVH